VVVGATVVGTEKLGATVVVDGITGPIPIMGKEKLRLSGMLAISMDMLPSVRAVDEGKEKLRLSGMLATAAETLPSS